MLTTSVNYISSSSPPAGQHVTAVDVGVFEVTAAKTTDKMPGNLAKSCSLNK